MLNKVVMRSTTTAGELLFNLRVNGDFSWLLHLLGKCLNPATSSYLQQFPQLAMSVADIESIIMKLDASKVCAGNGDSKFSTLTEKNEGKFKNVAGNMLKGSMVHVALLHMY